MHRLEKKLSDSFEMPESLFPQKFQRCRFRLIPQSRAGGNWLIRQKLIPKEKRSDNRSAYSQKICSAQTPKPQ
jgi:hypothetical protein